MNTLDNINSVCGALYYEGARARLSCSSQIRSAVAELAQQQLGHKMFVDRTLAALHRDALSVRLQVGSVIDVEMSLKTEDKAVVISEGAPCFSLAPLIA